MFISMLKRLSVSGSDALSIVAMPVCERKPWNGTYRDHALAMLNKCNKRGPTTTIGRSGVSGIPVWKHCEYTAKALQNVYESVAVHLCMG